MGKGRSVFPLHLVPSPFPSQSEYHKPLRYEGRGGEGRERDRGREWRQYLEEETRGRIMLSPLSLPSPLSLVLLFFPPPLFLSSFNLLIPLFPSISLSLSSMYISPLFLRFLSYLLSPFFSIAFPFFLPFPLPL